MIKDFIKQAKEGKSVHISTVRSEFDADKNAKEIYLILELAATESEKGYSIKVPDISDMGIDEENFVKDYVYASIYNILSALGGRKMYVFADMKDVKINALVTSLFDVFGINTSRKDRVSYARCINVIDRMLENVWSDDREYVPFTFIVDDIANKRDANVVKVKKRLSTVELFTKVTKGLEGKFIAGYDIGGTDIKVAVCYDGNIACFKEYDWFPTSFTRIDQLIIPIEYLIRLVRAAMTIEKTSFSDSKVEKLVARAMEKDASNEEIIEAVEAAEVAMGDDILKPDAVGLCFPDVVIKDKIVGGEVYKQRGIRNNDEIEYEAEFKKLINLDDRIRKYCKDGGVVKNTNDGNIAAYAAAIEIALTDDAATVEDGMFAHTLGTELGTGWVDENGDIPTTPLEIYNFIADLGNYPARQYESDDLRSINNFNTVLPGTLQKFGSQSGVFRFAIDFFQEKRPDLYKELFDLGFIIEREYNGKIGLYVPTEPVDMRKAFLAHLMTLPERENDILCDKMFIEVGESLGVTYLECQRVLEPAQKTRVLFGRLCKNRRCYDLMVQGAQSIVPDIHFEIADSSLANSSLMQQLDADPEYTVAQFGQAIGAIYFGNHGLIEKEQ